MSALPPALAPWATQLQLLPHELAVGLGGAVQRLSLAIGPLRARDGEGLDDPDGYSGLSRRGSYERLLASEWLLATEAPDEFLRRAAMKEHAFFALSHRRPAGSRRSVALFDAGPSQLGAPRIAQLALLIVLARRAEEARVEFRWGVLQEDRQELISTVDPASIFRLLRGRTPHEPTAADLAAWLERLGPIAQADDLWLVGAPRLEAERLSRVRIEDGAAPATVRVTVTPQRRPKREVELQLPEAQQSVRLLRDPFAVERPGPLLGLTSPPTSVRFDSTGRRLIVCTWDGGFTVFPLPNSPRAHPGKPRRFQAPTGEQLVAAGISHRKVLALTWSPAVPDSLTFRGHLPLLGGQGPRFKLQGHPFVAPQELTEVLLEERRPVQTSKLYFTDGGGTLWQRFLENQPVAVPMAFEVRAVALRRGGLAYVQGSGSIAGLGWPARLVVREAEGGVLQPVAQRWFEGSGDLKTYFGYGAHPLLGALAIRTEKDLWHVLEGDTMAERKPPPGAEVVGVIGTALLILEEDRRTLSLVGQNTRRSVTRAQGAILSVSTSPDRSDFAYLTARGEVTVYSAAFSAELLRLSVAGAEGMIRALVHRGHVEARAFWIDPAVIGEAEARRRVLALWRPGARVQRFGQALMIRLPDPVRIDAATAPGTPLVETAGGLTAAPGLEPDAPGVLVRVQGAQVERSLIADGNPEDPSSWLDVSELDLAEVRPLAAVEGIPVPPPEVVRGLRAALGNLPERSGEATELMSALAEVAGRPAVSRRPRWFARLVGWLADRIRGASPVAGAASHTETVRGPIPDDGLWTRLARRLERIAFGLTQLSGLTALLGRRHARYLENMLELFDQADLTEALRHAIPLGQGESSGRPMWGPPNPRDQLKISPTRAAGGPGLGVGMQLYAHLQQLYRAAFQRLERQGRFEEAAFVLAELLNASEEAVSFLERHGLLQQAAEVAEARLLPPGLVIRQWFLARDRARALRIARRTKAYADAIERLQRTHPEEAKQLRLLWGELLAEAGDFGAAVTAIWPVPEARALAISWSDRAIALGGPSGARALVWRLALEPARHPEIGARAAALLEDDALAVEHLAFAEELIGHIPPRTGPSTEIGGALRGMARLAVRALVRDAGRFGSDPVKWAVERLAKAAEDPSLAADLPALPRTGREGYVLPDQLRFAASEGGGPAVRDAVKLASGNVLAALGELGVRLISARGRVLRSFDVPADHLVPAHNGARAIAIATRGEVKRLSRLDLLDGSGRAWCDVRLDSWAPDYDGERWFVSEGLRIFAADALADSLRVLWHVPDLPAPVSAMAPPEARFTFAVGTHPPETWTIDSAGFTVRARQEVLLPAEAAIATGGPVSIPLYSLVLGQGGALAVLSPKLPPTSEAIELHADSPGHTRVTFPGPHARARGALNAGWLAVTWDRSGEVVLIDRKAGRVRCRIHLEGAAAVRARFTGGTLTLADDRGRIAVIDVLGPAPPRLLLSPFDRR